MGEPSQCVSDGVLAGLLKAFPKLYKCKQCNEKPCLTVHEGDGDADPALPVVKNMVNQVQGHSCDVPDCEECGMKNRINAFLDGCNNDPMDQDQGEWTKKKVKVHNPWAHAVKQPPVGKKRVPEDQMTFKEGVFKEGTVVVVEDEGADVTATVASVHADGTCDVDTLPASEDRTASKRLDKVNVKRMCCSTCFKPELWKAIHVDT